MLAYHQKRLLCCKARVHAWLFVSVYLPIFTYQQTTSKLHPAGCHHQRRKSKYTSILIIFRVSKHYIQGFLLIIALLSSFFFSARFILSRPVSTYSNVWKERTKTKENFKIIFTTPFEFFIPATRSLVWYTAQTSPNVSVFPSKNLPPFSLRIILLQGFMSQQGLLARVSTITTCLLDFCTHSHTYCEMKP